MRLALDFSLFIEGLSKASFLIEKFEEWLSDKQTTGPKAKMENRSRQKFPLFLAPLAAKI